MSYYDAASSVFVPEAAAVLPVESRADQGMKSLTQDRWLKTRDVADQLGIHLNTLARYMKAGEFGEILILSQTDKRIRESALEQFITRRLA